MALRPFTQTPKTCLLDTIQARSQNARLEILSPRGLFLSCGAQPALQLPLLTIMTTTEKPEVEQLKKQEKIQKRPAVFFRVSQNTWIEAIVRYLVYPREAGRVKTRMIKKMLERLNSRPELVMFPKSNMR